MKTLKKLFVLSGIALVTLTFNSCLDDDSYSLDKMWMSMATARPISDNSFDLTLDDGTTLWPGAPLYINYQPNRPQRVFINYTILGDNFQGYDHAIKLNLIDTVLTKEIAPNLGIQNDSIYGNDPVEIVNLWVGDGFLNFEYKAHFSGQVKHYVNLIQDSLASDTPYKLEFRHNAYTDDVYHPLRSGFVAYDLSPIDTEGQDINLVIKVNTFEGEKTFERKYNSGKIQEN